jgi:enoyl-[acyl-carrier protein] reductase/trans-2-enoyl-CoA reductase (NAD+)
MIRSNLCINAHPAGCAAETGRQIAYVQEKRRERSAKTPSAGGRGPKSALILGCSTGYGLASRIAAAFGYSAATVGVSFEKAGTQSKWGTPGWYNNAAFDRAAKDAGLHSRTLDGDAFSDDTRSRVVSAAKDAGLVFDLVIYSIASPVRTDPDTGVLYKSVLKPFGAAFTGVTVDIMTGKITTVSAEGATEEEEAATVKVMGGEDWARWMACLEGADVLARGCITVAYSYIGPALSHRIYRDGTIGAAKKHLERTARDMDAHLSAGLGGAARVSINKGLVTRSSAIIPIIPLYLSVLFRVMKERGIHEGCIEQMERLFAERLYTGAGVVPMDNDGLIRLDELEMDAGVQAEVNRRLALVTEENLDQLGDLAGYRHDFLAANGFDVPGVDYSRDTARFDMVD